MMAAEDSDSDDELVDEAVSLEVRDELVRKRVWARQFFKTTLPEDAQPEDASDRAKRYKTTNSNFSSMKRNHKSVQEFYRALLSSEV